MTKRASDAMRSQRIGLRLYAMADEPICSASNGSSISPTDCNMRMSPLNFIALDAMPGDDAETCASSLREYVCPETGIDVANPDLARHAASSSRTFS